MAAIDFNGISPKTRRNSNFSRKLFWIKSCWQKLYYFKSSMGNKMKLFAYDIDSQKESEIADANGYSISAMVRKWWLQRMEIIISLTFLQLRQTLSQHFNWVIWKVMVDRQSEWKQIFYESWRQMRDFSTIQTCMVWIGIKWKTYEQLLPYVNSRVDLTYVIGELIGELNCGHAYVGGGDYTKAERVPMGLLIAKLTKDGSGYYKLKKYIRAKIGTKSTRSPLTEIGVNVKAESTLLR